MERFFLKATPQVVHRPWELPPCPAAASPPRPMPPAKAKGKSGGDAVIGLDEEQIKLADMAGQTLPVDDDEISAAFDFFDVDGTVRPRPDAARACCG